MRIVEADTFERLERLLTGKTANGGPKRLAKGTKVTKGYLDTVERYDWFDIRLGQRGSRGAGGGPEGVHRAEAQANSTRCSRPRGRSSPRATSCRRAC